MTDPEEALKAEAARLLRILSQQWYIRSGNDNAPWYKYGMRSAAIAELMLKQGGRCACCGIDLEGVKWAIDHKHGTQKVRGILCYNCNVGIGHLGDSIEGLARAIAYLEKSNGQ